MTLQARSSEKRSGSQPDRFALPWVWLLTLCLAPLLIVSLTQDIGGHAFDSAVEHIYRGVVFSDVISDGVLYPRWTQALHWGLGSPLFTFQPPLPYYGMDLLYRFGVPHPIGWRMLIGAGFTLAFLGAYLLVREITGRRWPALVAAAAYVYAPYVIWNALERGSNETYSMFLYPLVLWSLLWLARRPSTTRFLVATGVWAACIGSHVLGPLILAPFAGLLALYLLWRSRSPAPLVALLAGVLLTAAIWLPMMPEQQWVHVERDFDKPEAIPAGNPLLIEDLLTAPVIYDVARDNNKSPLRTGILHTALLLAGAPALLLVQSRRPRPVGAALLAATLTGLFLFFMLTPWSNRLWELGGAVLARLLYRMRLMGLQTLAAASAAGLLVAILPHRWQRIIAPALVALFLLLALPSLYVQHQHAYADFSRSAGIEGARAMEIRHGGTALTAFGEFTPKWRTAAFDERLLTDLGKEFDATDRPVVNPEDGIAVQSARVHNQNWDLQLSANRPVTATLHLLYYPRWQVSLDGQPAQLAAQAGTGYIQVALPAGEHRLALHYGLTTAEAAGLAISGLTLLTLLTTVIWGRRRRRAGRPIKTPKASQYVKPAPGIWLLVGLTGLLVLKVAVIDPHTTFLRCASTAKTVCGAASTVDVSFQDGPRLRGYTVQSYHVPSGGELRLALFWQAVEGLDHPLASFVHVRPSAEGQPGNPRSVNGMWAQDEHATWDAFFSTEFIPGKLYKDDYRLRLPEDMPAGEYYLEVGWFNPETGEQLEPKPETVRAPLSILWRSVLLPNLRVGPAVQ